MNKLDISGFSARYNVRRLTQGDVEMLYAFCRENTQYYAYCGKDISRELIENDLRALPPETPVERKHYVGFFDGSTLVAIMDLIEGYPTEDDAFIGFFMMNRALQGAGAGSGIVSEVLTYLAGQGCRKCMLGIDKDNPQSNHFWRKNGFKVVRETAQEQGVILVAERPLTAC